MGEKKKTATKKNRAADYQPVEPFVIWPISSQLESVGAQPTQPTGTFSPPCSLMDTLAAGEQRYCLGPSACLHPWPLVVALLTMKEWISNKAGAVQRPIT